MQFIETENHSIAVIPKALSMSICCAYMNTFKYDVIAHRLKNSVAPIEDVEYKIMAEKTETPTKETVALIREPIDRFLSACAMNNTDVAETIEALKTGEGWQATHPIFEKQSYNYDKVFKFPAQTDDFCKYVGLPYPLPKLNESKNPKAKLTKEQIKFLENYYADDIKLYGKK